MHHHEFVLFCGTANPGLGRSVANELGVRLGRSQVERFPDGEVSVRLEESVRRKEVFILQPTAPPVDQHLVELLCFADAARRAAAERVTAVIPYFGYARADRRNERREPITARMIGDVLQAAGIDHVVTIDLHTPQIEGFFRIPVDSLSAMPVLADAVASRLRERAVVTAPDAGRADLAARYAERLGVPLVVVHKQRETASRTRVTRIVGDVEGRHCLIIDDMVATGVTLGATIDALLDAGAVPELRIAATHALLLPGARKVLEREAVAELVVTDTVAPRGDTRDWQGLRVVSVAPLIAAVLQQFVVDGSVRSLERRPGFAHVPE
jgi:ribose-phosphate pyrophosphokinase